MQILSTNKEAQYNYQILETYEAGLVLQGAEVKAAKIGQLSLKGSYVTIDNRNEAYLIGAHISPYVKSNPDHYIPTRSRKLLLHYSQIRSLLGKISQKGLTLTPLKVYNKDGLIKLEFALVRGKKKYDKRESLKKKDAQRKINAALREFK